MRTQNMFPGSSSANFVSCAKNVKLFINIPNNVCAYVHRENVWLLLSALSHVSDLSDKTSGFVEQIVWDPKSEDCMNQHCQVCANKIRTLAPFEDSAFTYQQRQTTNGVEIAGIASEAFEELDQQVKPF